MKSSARERSFQILMRKIRSLSELADSYNIDPLVPWAEACLVFGKTPSSGKKDRSLASVRIKINARRSVVRLSDLKRLLESQN